MSIAAVDARVVRVARRENSRIRRGRAQQSGEFPAAHAARQVKFVICSREDYDWSRAYLEEHALSERCQVLFSPSYTQVSPTTLAEWILADRLPVRFQLQFHKILWGDVPGK